VVFQERTELQYCRRITGTIVAIFGCTEQAEGEKSLYLVCSYFSVIEDLKNQEN
jgi:hypothetical protein